MLGSTLPYTLADVLTRQGGSHKQNDDRFGLLDARTEFIRRARKGAIYAVADGVTSTRTGFEAAEVVVEALTEFFTCGRRGTEELLLDIVESADTQVRLTTDSASTLTGIWLADGITSVFNLGDSAVLLFREGDLRRLTPEHTRGGGLAAYIGMGEGARPSTFIKSLPTKRDDVYLVCSDGLLSTVDEGELLQMCKQDPIGLPGRVEELLEQRGHHDDATLLRVIVLDVEADPWQEAAMLYG